MDLGDNHFRMYVFIPALSLVPAEKNTTLHELKPIYQLSFNTSSG